MKESLLADEYLAREISAKRKELEERLVHSCITGIHRRYYVKNDGSYNYTLLSRELGLGRKKVITIINKGF